MNPSINFLAAHRKLKSHITQREQEILHLIAYEHSSKEIAQKLHVSYETVNSHRKNMMDKLGVRNTAGLVRVAFETGLMRTKTQQHYSG